MTYVVHVSFFNGTQRAFFNPEMTRAAPPDKWPVATHYEGQYANINIWIVPGTENTND